MEKVLLVTNVFHFIYFIYNQNCYRFALDKQEQNKPESEDEIHEIVESVPAENSDDEWNNIPSK
jgi:hypothetical protein